MRAVVGGVGVIFLWGCAAATEAPPTAVEETQPACAASDAGPGQEAGLEADAGAADGGPEACVPHCPAGSYCGLADDGCGGQMECGTCSDPFESCGGGGVAHECGCTKVTCAEAQLCGRTAPDNCGGIQDCGYPPTDSVCEDSTPLSFTALGCFARAVTDFACAGLADGENCVRLERAGGVFVAVFDCPTAVALPQDLCSTLPGWTTLWNCCALPGCPNP